MEEFLSSFPRMEPASFDDYSTDVYQHSENVEINDDFDNEKSWFNFAVNVATGMFKNNNIDSSQSSSSSSTSNNNKLDKNNNNNNNSSSSNNRRRHRHQINIWGPSSFRQVSGLNDIPEESEGGGIGNNIGIPSEDITNDEDKDSVASVANSNVSATKEGSINSNSNSDNNISNNNNNQNREDTRSLEGQDDKSSVTSLEMPFMDDILNQQPALATSQIVESKSFNKIHRSVSYPSLLEEHFSPSNQSKAVSRSLVGNLDLEALNIGLGISSVPAAPQQCSLDKLDTVENDIDWSLKQSGHINNVSRLLDDDNDDNNRISSVSQTHEIANYFGVHSRHRNNNNNNRNTNEGTERIKDEKMTSAEHYNLYSRVKQMKKQGMLRKYYSSNNVNQSSEMDENEYTNDTNENYNDNISVNSSNSHVSSQYNMVHIFQNKVTPQKSGSVNSTRSSAKASVASVSDDNDTQFAFLNNNDIVTNEMGNDDIKSNEMIADDELAPSSVISNEIDDINVLKSIKSPSETLKLINSPIPQFSEKFAQNSRQKHKRKNGKKRRKRGNGIDGSVDGSEMESMDSGFYTNQNNEIRQSSQLNNQGTISDTESNMSSNVSWCVLSDK